MKRIQFLYALALALVATGAAHASDPKATIADLDARLTRIGVDDVVVVVDLAVAEEQRWHGLAGDEFVRISTNVLTPEGKRGIGTQLARNAAYEAVSKGGEYCGPIDVLGTAFDACYHPIKDAGGKIIGVSYIGHKK